MHNKKHYFLASLCKNGILGGGITIDENAVTYHTNKLTVSDKYRHLEMKYGDIEKIAVSRFVFLPVLTIQMKNDDTYKLIVFIGQTKLKDALAQNNIHI